jgi:hypothetical protein
MSKAHEIVFTGKMHYPLGEKDRNTFKTHDGKASSMH